MAGLRADHADRRSIAIAALLAASLRKAFADAAVRTFEWAFLAGASPSRRPRRSALPRTRASYSSVKTVNVSTPKLKSWPLRSADSSQRRVQGNRTLSAS